MANRGKCFVYSPPGDKSISQRAAIMAFFAKGKSELGNFSNSRDSKAVLKCIKKMGAEIIKTGSKVIIIPGRKIRKNIVLNCGESATAMRLLAGALSGAGAKAVLKAEKTLKNRSMQELAAALRKIGADVKLSDKNRPPVKIYPGRIKNSVFFQKKPSAQIKSAVILAGISSEKKIKFKESCKTRDHTERLLKIFKAPLKRKKGFLITGRQYLEGAKVEIPGDFSCAAYFLLAAILKKGAEIKVKKTGLNPLRTGLLKILKKMGADIKTAAKKRSWEPEGEIYASYSSLKGASINEREIISAVDELPLIALAACAAKGKTEIKVLNSLKNKESDRIETSIKLAQAIGAKSSLKKGKIEIIPCRLAGGKKVDFCRDHRIIMAAEIASLICSEPLKISGRECVKKSYPGFYTDLKKFKNFNFS